MHKNKTTTAIALLSCSVLGIVLMLFAGPRKLPDSIVVNEVLLDNGSVFMGANKEYYTWVELKNTTSSPASLAGCYLSDSPRSSNRHAFGDIMLGPGDILLVYGSGLGSQGPAGEVHTTFRITSKTKQILLYGPSGKLISKLYLPKVPKDISYGRSSNGITGFFLDTTPGYENSAQQFASIAKIGKAATGESPIVINEIAPKRQNAIYDERGIFPDYIELYNRSDEDIDLEGYFLADRDRTAAKYRLKKMVVPANGYLLLFASGYTESTNEAYIHLPFKIAPGETVALFMPDGSLVDSVVAPATSPNVTFGRSLDDPNKWVFSAYPTPGAENSPHGFDTNQEAEKYKNSPLVISEVLPSNTSYMETPSGDFEDLIEIHNRSDADISLGGWFLSDTSKDYHIWAFPNDLVLEAGGYLVVMASGKDGYDSAGNLHAAFKLRKDNEKVYLSNGPMIADLIQYGKMRNNISFGLADPDDRTSLVYFAEPTLGKANDTAETYIGFALPVEASRKSGVYDSPFSIELSCAQSSNEIHYTIDASKPDKNSPLYTSPIQIEKNTTIRAASFREGSLPSDDTVATYVFDKDTHGFPVFFLTADNSDLFGNSGVYHAPIGSRFRVPGHIELVEENGGGFSEDIMFRRHGTMSALNPQKSFALYFRERAGKTSLTYDLFPGDSYKVTNFRSFLLRTSGNDWADLKCKDAFATTFARDSGMKVQIQANRPAIVYVNGQYWGMYNIRDQANEHYLASHYGADPDNVDIISFGHGIHEGDYNEYNKLLDFVQNRNLNDPDVYRQLESMMDIDNYIDTSLCHIYYGNFDTVNFKWWRERTEGAKWQWILYDLDYAFYLPNQNNLALLTDPQGHGVDKLFSSDLIYNLMKSTAFRERFLERIGMFWDSAFDSDKILASFQAAYDKRKAELPDNFKRWDITQKHHAAEVAEFDDFLRRRPELFKTHVKNYFKLSSEEVERLMPKQNITHPKLEAITW
ncbi:MAG: lamin tail domain-containing protein [Eubacteriaceae bacterium]|nr:lamin tail domain-containing protein [Eubacteriaceae bacterium]